jgi:hypothetical protein
MTITPEQKSILKQLSQMIDLVEFQAYVGRKTKFGKQPGPEAWYHTRALLATYTDLPGKPAVEDVISYFKQLGIQSEVEAAMFVGVNIKHVG